MTREYCGDNQVFEKFGMTVVLLESKQDFLALLPFLSSCTYDGSVEFFSKHATYPLYLSIDSGEDICHMGYQWSDCGLTKFGWEYYAEHHPGVYQIFQSLDELFASLNDGLQEISSAGLENLI